MVSMEKKPDIGKFVGKIGGIRSGKENNVMTFELKFLIKYINPICMAAFFLSIQ